jgi:hypothetical protein
MIHLVRPLFSHLLLFIVPAFTEWKQCIETKKNWFMTCYVRRVRAIKQVVVTVDSLLNVSFFSSLTADQTVFVFWPVSLHVMFRPLTISYVSLAVLYFL